MQAINVIRSISGRPGRCVRLPAALLTGAIPCPTQYGTATVARPVHRHARERAREGVPQRRRPDRHRDRGHGAGAAARARRDAQHGGMLATAGWGLGHTEDPQDETGRDVVSVDDAHDDPGRADLRSEISAGRAQDLVDPPQFGFSAASRRFSASRSVVGRSRCSPASASGLADPVAQGLRGVWTATAEHRSTKLARGPRNSTRSQRKRTTSSQVVCPWPQDRTRANVGS